MLRRVGNIVVYLGREAEASAALTTQSQRTKLAGWQADFSLVHPRSAALASPLQSPDSAQPSLFPFRFGHAATLVQSGQSVQSTPHLLYGLMPRMNLVPLEGSVLPMVWQRSLALDVRVTLWPRCVGQEVPSV